MFSIVWNRSCYLTLQNVYSLYFIQRGIHVSKHFPGLLIFALCIKLEQELCQAGEKGKFAIVLIPVLSSKGEKGKISLHSSQHERGEENCLQMLFSSIQGHTWSESYSLYSYEPLARGKGNLLGKTQATIMGLFLATFFTGFHRCMNTIVVLQGQQAACKEV